MKKALTLILLFLCAWNTWAQKSVYIPAEWKNPWPSDSLLYAEEDPDGRYTWSKTRSRETDNVIVFWDKFYGNKAPDELSKSNYYYVDINDLLQKCESFFDLELNTLGFVDPETSNLSRYKIMVLMNHTQTWTCYGGGYDYQVSALWLNPATCKPVGHSVAHEIGHSFHYMCYSESSNHGTKSNVQTGFHSPIGNGSVTWEQTAQWQANQSYPELMFDQSIGVFRNSHNLAFTHEWHRYQSYWFFYYLCQLTGRRTAVADVWNYNVTSAMDFNQVLMRQQGWKTADLYRHYYEYAARCATWDFEACEPYRQNFIGDFHYAAAEIGPREYQVAFESTPQSTGFNVIPLNVPVEGTEIRATFVSLRPNSNTPLAEADPALYLNGDTQWSKTGRTTYYTTGAPTNKGFRLGYVALLKDGSRLYFNEDSIYCKGNGVDTARVAMTVPAATERLWMIVSPAPSKYFQHLWDEKYNQNDDAWPYRVAFDGTDINESQATIYCSPTMDGRATSDVTFTYDVYLPQRSSFDPVLVTVGGSAAALLGTAFQLQPSDIASHLVNYSSAGPKEGKIMFYPLNNSTLATVSRSSTANGYGHWFASSGNVSDYASGYLYSEFAPASLTFSIGQNPGKVSAGQTFTIGQALVYNDGQQKATARFVFRVHITNGQSGFELAEKTNAISSLQAEKTGAQHTGTYDIGGRPVSHPTHGLYIINGKKTLLK